MRQHGLGGQARQGLALGAKGHQRHPDPGGAGGLAVGFGITDQKGSAHLAAGIPHRRDIGPGVGLADRQRIGSDHCGKAVADAQFAQQYLGQGGGLVGADRQPVTVGGQPLKRRFGAGIQPGVDGDRLGVMVQQARIVVILGPRGQQHVGGQAGKACTQHGPAAMERDQRIRDRVQQCSQPARLKAGIGCRDQVGRGIGQGSVQIENHCSRHAAVTFRQDV